MAKVTGPLFSVSASGTVGKAFTFGIWKGILQAIPTLEPAICGMADGNAYWVDRLRLCGNGVVPVVAAYAFIALAREARMLEGG